MFVSQSQLSDLKRYYAQKLAFRLAAIEFGAGSNLMRNLAESRVLKEAAIAALASAGACYPRLAVWSRLNYPLWYLEAMLVLGSFVLWAFVFAWHEEYTHRRIFTLKLRPATWLLATAGGMFLVLGLHGFVDPTFRARMPEDYPATFKEWTAMTLFGLGFSQLFLVFAPFDWAVRLFKRRWIGIGFTVLFGVFVAALKVRSSREQFDTGLVCLLLIARAGTSFVSVWLYSRYGMVLAWWWSLLLQSRHLPDLHGRE